ncbi:hypothetical protein N806_24550 [Rhodococcus sp. P27]|nr:hypothetical protein N806_24550 [Rhodococcus sp. P27]
MEGTHHMMVDGNGVKSRFNDWRPAPTPLRKYLGGPAGDRVSQVRGLGGSTEVLRLHPNAQGFVAAVFADSSIGKFVVNQERERLMLDAEYVLRADEIPDGGFNRSSQHLDQGERDGAWWETDSGGAFGYAAEVGSGQSIATADAFTRAV